jgi:hypothetical protein
VSARQKPSRVYVIGAGFSAGLGYPTTNELLIKVWDRLDGEFRKKLARIISFHYPEFDEVRRTTFPELEPLLSAMEANRELFDHTRAAHGNFSPEDIKEGSEGLLWYVAQWFDEIHKEVKSGRDPWLKEFCAAAKRDQSTIISFNWDLVLDELLIEENRAAEQYGFVSNPKRLLLLKPHGSLNWFDGHQAANIKNNMAVLLMKDQHHPTYAFTKFRSPRSKIGRKYNPLIIPPHYMKRFDRPGFRELWQKCVSELSTAAEVVFIGYSLPPADFHARFMLRCAFHNQVDGVITGPKSRGQATGPPKVIVVNPDLTSARRIETATFPHASFEWIPSTAGEWVGSLDWFISLDAGATG